MHIYGQQVKGQCPHCGNMSSEGEIKASAVIRKGRGGKRNGAGRKRGSINGSRADKRSIALKAKDDIMEMAREYAPIALKALTDIAEAGESESARVSASSVLLDRAYGKAIQPVAGQLGAAIQINLVIGGIDQKVI